MSNIKPFICVRPAEDKVDKIAALPYDVYNRAEAKAVVTANPQSFLAIDRAETQFGDEVDTYDERVYAKAHEMLSDWIDNGSFVRDTQNAYYIYELTMDGRVQTGIVACASIDDYANNIIKKHENTRADKEADRIHHVDTCSAQTGPIFLAYRNNPIIGEVVAAVKQTPALYDFVADDGIRHRVFKIGDATQIEAIQNAFAGIDDIYIADGHHRCASAVKVALKRRKEHPDYEGTEEFNYFMSVLFADNELKIMDYNRLILDAKGQDHDSILAFIRQKCDVEGSFAEPVRPEKKGQFGMYDNTGWYRLTIRKEYKSDDAVEGLDVSILQREILQPLFAIEDPKTDLGIDFVGGIRGLHELERRVNEDAKVAFSMYPTSIQELFSVADQGKLMPPKSTWFEPKLRSGIFIHRIERL